jgi:phosphatidylinositol glycan class Q protein
MGAPAGFKLNRNLNHFLGTSFLWFIELWSNSIEKISIYLNPMITFFGVCGFFGFSFVCSIIEDFISILTLYHFLLYIISSLIFRFHFKILVSLFHIFRGKKQNVLRYRIDDCEYDLDHVLLGTIFFTCFFFLLPTVLIYYILFMMSRIMIVLIYSILEFLLGFFYLFPFFTLFSYLNNPSTLSGGLKWSLIDYHKFLDENNEYKVYGNEKFWGLSPIHTLTSFEGKNTHSIELDEEVKKWIKNTTYISLQVSLFIKKNKLYIVIFLSLH